MGRDGASNTRRLIRLIAVDRVPPDVRPSGACLRLGASMLSLFTPSRGAPHRGGVSCPGMALRSLCSRPPGAGTGHLGTSLAIAHRKATSALAMPTTTWWACVTRARSVRSRLHNRTCAFQLMSWIAWEGGSSRRCQCRRTVVGSRYAQAPSTRARRAWVWPVLVIEPGRDRSPLESSEGVRPT